MKKSKLLKREVHWPPEFELLLFFFDDDEEDIIRLSIPPLCLASNFLCAGCAKVSSLLYLQCEENQSSFFYLEDNTATSGCFS